VNSFSDSFIFLKLFIFLLESFIFTCSFLGEASNLTYFVVSVIIILFFTFYLT